MNNQRLVPHSEIDARDWRTASHFEEFWHAFRKQVPFIPPSERQRVIVNDQTQSRLRKVLEAFFLVDAGGFDPREQDDGLANLLAAHLEGWRMDLYRPRWLEVNLPSTLVKDLGMDVMGVTSESLLSNFNDCNVRVDLQRIFLSQRVNKDKFLLSDQQRNALFGNHQYYGLWLALALIEDSKSESKQSALDWLCNTNNVSHLVFLGNDLCAVGSRNRFVLGIDRGTDERWKLSRIPVTTEINDEMRFPLFYRDLPDFSEV
ncbi:MAG: hypothetical protein WCW14_00495 [Candidatus Paceibacterota bacterium]|jgi:hypothetical protein